MKAMKNYRMVEQVRKKYGQPEMALVIPMQSFRKTISNVFKNIKGLSPKMVIGPAEVTKRKYDLLIVDEGHRLRQRTNLSSYYHTFDQCAAALGLDKYTCSELDWVQLQSHKSIIFYDEFQSVKPSDTEKNRFLELQEKSSTRIERLRSQFRVKGNENLRNYLSQYIPVNGKNKEQEPTILFFDSAVENSVPYYDIEAAAGSFSELQEQGTTRYIQLQNSFYNHTHYFACKVIGESMNKVIPNGSICLFERYGGGSRNGLITLVECSSFEDKDFGSNYTVKEYSSKKTVTEDSWHHEEIILLPRSTDTSYQPIHLRDEELLDFHVIGVIKKVL